MSKIVGAIVTLILLNMAMFVFTFSGTCPEGGCELEDYNTEANSTVWAYFANPQDQTETDFWKNLFSSTQGILGLLTVGTLITAGLLVGTKDINIAYITVAGFIIAAIIGTWVRFLGLITNTSFILGGKSGGVVATIVVGTLLAVQLFNVIDWGRGKD